MLIPRSYSTSALPDPFPFPALPSQRRDTPAHSHPSLDLRTVAHARPHQHAGSVPCSTRGSARGIDDHQQHRRGPSSASGAGSNRAPSAPGGSARGGNAHGDDGDHSDEGDGPNAGDDPDTEPDYGGIGSHYKCAASCYAMRGIPETYET